MHAERTDRSTRREAVLRTTYEEGPESASYIAYCAAYPLSTVTADLRWMESEGFVRSETAPFGFINGLGRRAQTLWHVTDKGTAYALGADA